MSLTTEQVEALLQPLDAGRVRVLKNKGSHLEAWDVRRHLLRVFGWGGWEFTILNLDLVSHTSAMLRKKNKQGEFYGEPYEGHTVIYRCTARLTIRDPQGNYLTHFDDGATGDSVNQPSLGDAHDMAMKTALSQALKRCAANLGTRYGLGLYNDGKTDEVVRASLAHNVGTSIPPSALPPDAPVRAGELDNEPAVEEQRPAPVTVIPDRPAPVTDVPLPPDATTAQSLVTELYAHRTVPRELTKIMARVSALRLQTTEVAAEHGELVPLGELCNRLLNAATGRSA